MDEVHFIGIGAGRSGTTWIVNILSDHPEIFCPEIGKLNYFANIRPLNTESEYDKRGIIPYLKLFQGAKENQIKGEFSSYYMVNPKTAQILKKHFPNAKIWACIREPVERAYSDWLAFKNFKVMEKDNFETAFFKEQKGLYPEGDGYRHRGFYYKQLKPYFDLFPKENIKIILYDDIVKDPLKIAKEFYEFLGVDSSYVPKNLNERPGKSTETKYKFLRKSINSMSQFSHKLEKSKFGGGIFWFKRTTKINEVFNKINDINVKESEKEKLDPELKKKLKAVYLEDIEQLEKLINRDLSAWKS